ncbi:hypothetical protein B0H14DRAFT_2583810 [Mycena olivaceomarginata]|nr:hypothetical protein B0H14DRAFT_2583810 [Mycena olivaceomarginata]
MKVPRRERDPTHYRRYLVESMWSRGRLVKQGGRFLEGDRDMGLSVLRTCVNYSTRKPRHVNRRGSVAARTSKRGKEIRRKCIGILECTSRECTANMRIAPAARGIDRHRQLRTPCLCGEKLRLRECGIESTVSLFRDGGLFINSGDHTNPKFTHSPIYHANEPYEFTEYVATHPVALESRTEFQGTNVSSSTSSDSEESWHGIQGAGEHPLIVKC